MESAAKVVTAAVLVIGNEILSGRTRDTNTNWLATRLTALGIRLREARVVPDDEAEIVTALNVLRARYDYVFTSGGIGPTHDDITADCIAKAFDTGIDVHPDARARLEAYYPAGQLNEARLRMARIPHGAALVDNPVSIAPGFHIGNVYVFAGVPAILQAMFEGIRHELAGGDPLLARAIAVSLPEGQLAPGLGAIQARHPATEIGSYPFFRGGRPGCSIVVRATDRTALDAAAGEVRALMTAEGGEPQEQPS
jgi:molybdenum cofactor synthesis domain-containing protein